MVISRLDSGPNTAQKSSTSGFIIDIISGKNALASISPLVVILSNPQLSQAHICHAATVIIPWQAETAVQVSKALQISLKTLSLFRKCEEDLRGTGMKAVVKKKSPICYKSIVRWQWILQLGTEVGLWRTGSGWHSQRRLNSTVLGHMAGDGVGKGQEKVRRRAEQ